MSLAPARELAVLSILLAHPAHGYQIAAAFEKGPFQLLGIKRSAVYAILKRFAARGWIVELEEKGSTFPDRRVSHITEAGRVAASEMISEAGGLPQSPLMVLMLLHDSGQDVAPQLTTQLELRRGLLDNLTDAGDEHSNSATRRLAQAVVRSEIETIEQILNA